MRGLLQLTLNDLYFGLIEEGKVGVCDFAPQEKACFHLIFKLDKMGILQDFCFSLSGSVAGEGGGWSFYNKAISRTV